MSSLCSSLVACVLLGVLVSLQAEPSQGHITFFSPKEMMLMKEREGKKDMEPHSDDGQFQDITIQELPEHGVNSEKSVEIAVRLPQKQLDHVAPVLEEIVEEHQKA